MDFNKYELIIFDADGTLRECTVPGQEYPIDYGQWIKKSNVCHQIEKYDWQEKLFGIATNQPGISQAVLSEEKCVALIEEMVADIFGFLPEPEAMQFCPHHPDEGCQCRKPKPGMLLQIMTFYQVNSSSTLFIGDSDQDRGAAESAGCDFLWADEIPEK